MVQFPVLDLILYYMTPTTEPTIETVPHPYTYMFLIHVKGALDSLSVTYSVVVDTLVTLHFIHYLNPVILQSW